VPASPSPGAFYRHAGPDAGQSGRHGQHHRGLGPGSDFADGSKQSYKLAYQPFFMTGDMVPDGKGGTILAGGYYDINNQPIIDRSVAGKERQFFSDCPDGRC
jgi:hypothetical protein